MKRSEINAAISEAKDMIDRYSWVLPKWGYWSKEEYNNCLLYTSDAADE